MKIEKMEYYTVEHHGSVYVRWNAQSWSRWYNGSLEFVYDDVNLEELFQKQSAILQDFEITLQTFNFNQEL